MYPQLLSYAIRHLGSDYSFWAEDCVQDSFYKAYEHRIEFSNPFLFKSYLFSCIHNKIISILRHNEAVGHYVESNNANDESEEFVNSIIEQETLDILYSAIKSLPENLQTVFKLSYVEGKKNAEIAEILNISERTVKRQKSTMIQMLRQYLVKKTGNDLSALRILLPVLTYLEMSV
jgi:RNA polymerase sigma-70 factor (ECF subfamily)